MNLISKILLEAGKKKKVEDIFQPRRVEDREVKQKLLNQATLKKVQLFLNSKNIKDFHILKNIWEVYFTDDHRDVNIRVLADNEQEAMEKAKRVLIASGEEFDDNMDRDEEEENEEENDFASDETYYCGDIRKYFSEENMYEILEELEDDVEDTEFMDMLNGTIEGYIYDSGT